jgi:hypothetical protein
MHGNAGDGGSGVVASRRWSNGVSRGLSNRAVYSELFLVNLLATPELESE